MNPNDAEAAPVRAPEGVTDALQFERAEPIHEAAAADSECHNCHRPVSSSYYLLNGLITCSECIDSKRVAEPQEPTTTDLSRAALFGAGAALAGTGIYFAVLALSGYEIGWIAVVVGWLVGKAVHKGSRGLGGRKLQWMAVALTYFSIVGSYVPLIVKSAIENPPGQKRTVDAGAQRQQDAQPAPSQPSLKDRTTEVTSEPSISISGLVIGLAILFAYALVLPFVQGLSSILGLFIIAIGLFEAWKWNRRAPVIIEGPFPVSPVAGSA
jgi:hypothetical protein